MRSILITMTAGLLLCGGGVYAARVPVAHQAGTFLPDTGSNYDWHYGCSPTAAGMMMGYYDRNGYTNLVPGGDAEVTAFPTVGSLVADVIASSGHVSDFYGGGYLASGDDVPSPTHSFDCLADFMGTSQDSVGNSNGSTTFYYFTDGSPFTESDAVNNNVADRSGMYGIGEYLEYAGYDAAVLYNQYTDTRGLPYGFTFDQYKAEIDAGRPVLVHTENHTMYGYGYDDVDHRLYVYDTWNDLDGSGPYTNGQNPGYFSWGGSYSGAEHMGVTILQLSAVPEPASLLALLSMGTLGLAFVMFRKRKQE